jgi:DNA polymerase III epsilon subunit-like protein|tara:strand:+ start:2606 stop:3919 length:1314 start_codon:yes stop_codon:yes gene_type:complete
MNYIAWDTETIGLPKTRKGERATVDNVHKFDKCRMLTLAFVKYNYKGEEVGSYHGTVYPDTFDVDATHVHGITQEYARENGQPFGYLYASLKEATKDTKLLVAHNSLFDENVFFSECYRRGFDTEPFDEVTFVDTLDMARSIYPTLNNHKLITLYDHIFGEEFDGAHDALNDARACGKVYNVMRDKKWEICDIGVDRVVIKASDVAAIIGKNQYKKPLEIIDNLWSKYKPDTFEGKTKDQCAVEAIEKCKFSMGILKDTETYKSFNSIDVERKFKAVSNQLDLYSNLRGDDKKCAIDYLRKTLYTNHGTRHEDTTADNYSDLEVDENFYTYPICSLEGTTYEIVGRIDRVRYDYDGNKTIVEIKNRTRNLFKTVRDYEEIQCQTYMEMMDVNNCELIEQYNDSRIGYAIIRDKQKWLNEIDPKLKKFCEYFHHLLSK